MDVIQAVGLHRLFKDVVAVAGIDLRVRQGEIVAVLGPNGAGKTTTIEMLLGLRTPTSGSVRVFGASPSTTAVRGRVGAMLQDTDAPESLTVAEMVNLVASYYPFRLPAKEVLQRANLEGHAGHRVSQLSGGLRQRLSFALSIVGDPDLLFLDEPTAALDVQARRAFWEQVKDFAALGKTILFSTHNLAEADALADRIVVIDSGVVVKDGTPHQIKQLVAGRTIGLLTDASEDELRSLPGVRGVTLVPSDPATPGLAEQTDGIDGGGYEGQQLRRMRVQAVEAEPVLRALFTTGRYVGELTVHEASLEEAFVHLTTKQAVR